MKHPNHLIITVLLLLNGSLLLSCAAVSESADFHTAVGEPTPTTVVASADSTDATVAAETTAAEFTHTEAAVTDTSAVKPAEIEFSCYAVIESNEDSGHGFLVTMTEDAFYNKGSRLILRVTEDTVLMQEDGTPLSRQDFQAGDPIGVVIEGMIQETDPAAPECVTMIVKLNS
jgi:hypothetical protein